MSGFETARGFVRRFGVPLAATLELGLAACGTNGTEGVETTIPATTTTVPEGIAKCADSNTRPPVTAINAATYDDDRQGSVYACMLLGDMRIPTSMPTPLFKMSETTISGANFKMSGSLSGFALFGTGIVSGHVNASGQVTEEPAYMMTFQDMDGTRRRITLRSEGVRVMGCKAAKELFGKEPCGPSLFIDPVAGPLYSMGANAKHQSIWTAQATSNRTSNSTERFQVVSQIALKRPGIDGEGMVYTGGPDLAGQVVAKLARQTTIILPDDVLANSNIAG